MLTTVRRSRPKGPLRAVPGATNNRKIGGRLCYCDTQPLSTLQAALRAAWVGGLADRSYNRGLVLAGLGMAGGRPWGRLDSVSAGFVHSGGCIRVISRHADERGAVGVPGQQ